MNTYLYIAFVSIFLSGCAGAKSYWKSETARFREYYGVSGAGEFIQDQWSIRDYGLTVKERETMAWPAGESVRAVRNEPVGLRVKD
jgi:hypothetical protein